MHELEERIMREYLANPHNEYTTTDLVKRVFPKKYAALQQDLEREDAEVHKRAVRAKTKLHRKLLYHINKLVDKKVMQISRVVDRGERVYALAIDAGQVTIQDDKQTITIHKYEKPETYIRPEEEQGFAVSRVEGAGKVESIALNAAQYPGIHHLLDDLQHVYTHVNDCIIIANFDHFLTQDSRALQEGLQALLTNTKDYGISMSLLWGVKKPFTPAELAFIRHFASLRPKRLYLIFSGSTEALKAVKVDLARTADAFSNAGIKLNLKRAELEDAHAAMGLAGTYTLSKQQLGLLAKRKAIIVSSTSICLDFGKKELDTASFRDVAKRCAKTILARLSLQRRTAHQSLKGLLVLAPARELFERVENAIRIWNYTQDDTTRRLLQSTQEQLREFTSWEQRIFTACGAPLYIHVAFASAFPHYAETLSPRTYTKQPIRGRASLSEELLQRREQFCDVLQGDRVRLFREAQYDQDALMQELLHILKTYHLGLVTYDFNKLQTTMSLDQFL